MRARPTTEANGESSMAAGGGAGTNTTNSEATRAQGDETLEPDGEATEHDISTAAESIDPNSETQLQVKFHETRCNISDSIRFEKCALFKSAP